MKITPVAGPKPVEGRFAQSVVPQQSARERAINMLINSSSTAANPPPVASNPLQEASPSQPQQNTPNQALSAPIEGQNTTPDASTSAPAVTKAPEETPALSSQYAQLARKERAIQAKARELKALEAQLNAQKSQPVQAAPPQQPSTKDYIPRERLASDPWSVLSELGISYDQLTQQALNAPTPDQLESRQTIAALRAEIAAIREAQEGTQKSFQESQTQSYQAALKQIEADASSLIRSNPDAYEVSSMYGQQAIDTIKDVIEKTYREDGYLMTVEDAAQEVENFLLEEAVKAARLKKIQARLTPAQAAVQQPAAAQQKPQPAMRTLTNAQSTPGKLSARDRAILAAEGKLNR